MQENLFPFLQTNFVSSDWNTYVCTRTSYSKLSLQYKTFSTVYQDSILYLIYISTCCTYSIHRCHAMHKVCKSWFSEKGVKTEFSKKLRVFTLQVQWTYNHARTISLRFLVIILRLLRLEVSLYNVYIQISFKPLFHK